MRGMVQNPTTTTLDLSAKLRGQSLQVFVSRDAAPFSLLLAQVLLFWIFPSVHCVWLLTTIAFHVLVCFGGGFGTMPAFAADYFGSKNMAPFTNSC